MSLRAALPFHLSRSEDEFSSSTVVTRTETIHGLLMVENDRLRIQWRRARRTDRVGMEIRTEREVDPVRETVLPLEAVAGGRVKEGFWNRFTGPRFVLVAADLKAFDELAGAEGLDLDHPAELVLRVRRGDRLLAREFAADLALALANRPRGPELGPGGGPERITD